MGTDFRITTLQLTYSPPIMILNVINAILAVAILYFLGYCPVMLPNGL